jgi:hypothetical protein
MALPLWAALSLGSAGLGALKSELIDKPNENKDRIMAAITTRYSPWTGLRAKEVERTNPLGEMLAFGSQGAAMGQNIEAQQSQQKLQDMLSEKLARDIATPEERAAGAIGKSSDLVEGPVDIQRLLRESQAKKASFGY